MTNPWIDHVKQYANAHNLSYREALSKAKPTYNPTGGSRNSDIVKALIGKNKFDINRVNDPSEYLLKKYVPAPKKTRRKKIKDVIKR